MKLAISRPAARSAALAAVAARVFLLLALDAGPTRGGRWLSALLGALPALFLMKGMETAGAGRHKTGISRKAVGNPPHQSACGCQLPPGGKPFGKRGRYPKAFPSRGRWPAGPDEVDTIPRENVKRSMRLKSVCVADSAALCAATLADSAVVLSAVIRSAGYLALDHVPEMWLALPVCLTVLWCVCRNGDAAGYGAALWARLFPALLLVVALLQLRHFRPAWLAPVLGGGWGAVSWDALGVAGSFIPASAVLVLSEPDAGPAAREKDGLAKGLVGSFAVAALLLALKQMMAPAPLAGDTWLVRLDALLTNGRAPLYLQLPMIVLWYAGLLHLLLCEGFAAAALLQRLFPALDGRLCGALAVSCAGLAAFSALPERLREGGALQWLCVAALALTGMGRIVSMRMKGGAEACEE